MDWEKYFDDKDEKPLDRLVEGYSHTSIFRTMAFIGDSLSSGEFEIRLDGEATQYHDLYEYSWGQFIARKNGLKAYNFSRGGMSAGNYLKDFADDRGLWERAKACQAYVIAMGVNDLYGGNIELGTLDDIKEDYRDNAKTFLGNYAAIVMRYKKISPDAKFFFVTFPKGKGENDEKTDGMIRVLYDLAGYFDNSYVIDLNKYGPAYDDEFRRRFYLNGHMNPQGYLFTAKLVDSYIDYIIRHNPEDFKYAGLIGTNIRYK